MKRKISLFLCALIAMLCVLTAAVAANTYFPDDDGLYTLPLEFEANNEYIVIVMKGTYDQTNYIEAYRDADDSEILYFEQKVSDADGCVTFGPFAPLGYYDSTVIVGGANLDEMYLAGHLSAEGVSNAASISVSGVAASYTVKGAKGNDYSVEIETAVYDSFGYPSVTDEEVTIELVGNGDGVSIEGNVLKISKTAKEQAFTIKASAGETSKMVFVEVKRETPAYYGIEVYADSECTQVVNEINIVGLAGEFAPVTVYAKTYDQYGDEIEDTHEYIYGGKKVSSTFTPELGTTQLIVSGNGLGIEKWITVITKERPDYKDSALELYELINSCKAKLSEEKIISADGKDVFPEEKWTTQKAVNTFSAAISTAEEALASYGSDGYSDSDYSDEVTALTNALNTYTSSFKSGIRKDVDEIYLEDIDETSVITIVAGATYDIRAITTPNINLSSITDVLTWTSSDETVATVTPGTSGRATIKGGFKGGKATITVTTRGGLTASCEVSVVVPTSKLDLTPADVTATYGGETVTLLAKIYPSDSNDTINWTVDDPSVLDLEFDEYIDGEYRVIAATVTPKKNGKATVKVESVYGKKYDSSNVKTVMPEWETVSAPKADKESGSVLAGTEISLDCDTDDVTIYYTLDGTTPSKKNGRIYKFPIALSQSLTLRAVAVKDGMYDSEIAEYEYLIVDTKAEISKLKVTIGDVAHAALSISDYKNVTDATIVVEYDSSLYDSVAVELEELEGVTANKTEQDGKITVTLESESGFTYSGKLASLDFDLKDETAAGEYAIRITKAEVKLADGTNYNAATVDGALVVYTYIPGDANDDGSIGLADVMLIKQYLAGKESAKKTIVLDAADVDADGDVDNDDVILLSKYCVGWNVTFGKQSEDVSSYRTFGKQPEDVSSYRIISSYDVGQDADENWRYYYEVYNPLTGLKTSDIPSVKFDGKASNLTSTPALKEGTVVRITEDAMIDDSVSALVGSINLASCVWIKSANENAMVVVPVDNALECKNCATEYVENYSGTTYNDFLGNKQQSNVVTVTEDTAFVIMEYSSLGSSFLKWSNIRKIDYEDVIEAKNYIRCYNDKSVDRDDNYETTYADYVKALVCANESGEAEFVIVVKNDDDAAAYNVPCDNCK